MAVNVDKSFSLPQFVFFKGRSTTQQLLNYTCFINCSLNEKSQIVLFVDFTKAFDKLRCKF